MELGALEMRRPRFSFIPFGLSAPERLLWVSKNDETEIALDVDELAAAYLCNKCGTLVVPPERM
jgi:hypothetical protein